jgi:hypothetical protein
VRSSNNGHTERNFAVSSAGLSMLGQHSSHQGQDATFIYLRILSGLSAWASQGVECALGRLMTKM